MQLLFDNKTALALTKALIASQRHQRQRLGDLSEQEREDLRLIDNVLRMMLRQAGLQRATSFEEAVRELFS